MGIKDRLEEIFDTLGVTSYITTWVTLFFDWVLNLSLAQIIMAQSNVNYTQLFLQNTERILNIVFLSISILWAVKKVVKGDKKDKKGMDESEEGGGQEL